MRCERYLALPLGELAAQPPERETWLSLCLLLPFERACKALSVTFGDSSPRGRAKGLQLNHNDAGGKRSQACSCVPPQKPAQVQPDIRPFSMPFSCVAICPAMRKRPRVREIKHTVRGRNNYGKIETKATVHKHVGCYTAISICCPSLLLQNRSPRDQRNHVGGAVAGRTVCADQRGGPDAPLFRSAAI